jgi:hypothetical protein
MKQKRYAVSTGDFRGIEYEAHKSYIYNMSDEKVPRKKSGKKRKYSKPKISRHDSLLRVAERVLAT